MKTIEDFFIENVSLSKRVSEKIRESLLISELVISESITMVGSFEGGKAGKIIYEYFIDKTWD